MRKAALKSDAPPLTEQDIRRLAIGYLRIYYRYRPRRDFLGTETHDKPHVFRNKITIDARLTFFEEDGTQFIATVEATDLKRRQELDYRFNWAAILQDALAAGLVFGALYLLLPRVWSGIYGVDLLSAAGWWQLGRNSMLGMAIYVLLTHRRVAYRYIYAVNQFRRFYANDQWVAFDAALYPEPLDPRLLELERQCVRFGFGMMIVEPDRSVRLLVAPSKIDQFAGSRRQLPPWVERATKLPGMDLLRAGKRSKKTSQDTATDDQHTAPPAWGQAQLSREQARGSANLDPLSTGYLAKRSTAVKRNAAPPTGLAKMRQNYRRWWIHRKHQWRELGRSMVNQEAPLFYRFRPIAWAGVVMALLTFVGVYYMERYEQETVRLGEARSVENITNLEPYDTTNAPKPEQADIDRALARRANRPAAGAEMNEHSSPLSEMEDEPEVLGGTDLYSYRLEAGLEPVLRYECSRLYELVEEPAYLIVAGQFTQFVEAQRATARIHELTGLATTLIRSSCLQVGSSTNFTLYLSELLTNEAEANYLLRSWVREFGLELEILEIR